MLYTIISQPALAKPVPEVIENRPNFFSAIGVVKCVVHGLVVCIRMEF
jgi:hypothetical protein